MELQNFEVKNQKIRQSFEELKKQTKKPLDRLKLSWSNWGFGMESLADSASRLSRVDVKFIELHGNHYGKDLGYKPTETMKILNDYDIKVAGICGMFSAENDLSSNNAISRQNAIDYIKREIDFAAEMKAVYILIVPGAVGRSNPYDDSEFQRSVETIKLVADLFVQYDIKAAVEPIRSAEVSFCHTIADAKKYIQAVNHPGVKCINGDLYHMLTEQSHIGQAILDAGQQLTNLHMADSNRCALGEGSLDLDIIIMALYLIGYNERTCFCTPEPLGPGGNPYPAMFGMPDQKKLDDLVTKTVKYFRHREELLLA